MIQFIRKITTNRYFETSLFFIVALINLLPALENRFFPSMDGAAHLYNAKLISLLIMEDNDLLHMFYTFNEVLVPNWIGHFILSVSGYFLPAYLAEKVLLIIYFLGLPFAFRALIRTIAPHSSVISFFIFPFTYSFLFTLGFYNFSLAIMLMCIALTLALRSNSEVWSGKLTVGISALLILTYFSHIVICGLVMLFLGLKVIWDLLYAYIEDRANFMSVIRLTSKRLGRLLVASAIPLALSFNYFSSMHSGESSYEYLERGQLIDWIYSIKPLISYNDEIEGAETSKMCFIMALMLGIGIFERVNRLLRDKKASITKAGRTKAIRADDIWAIFGLVCLLMYFFLPNSDGKAGFISVRLALLFFLFWTLYLAVQKLPKWFNWVCTLAFLFFSFNLNNYYSTVSHSLSKIARDCEETSRHIDRNSIVLPLNYHPNWLSAHFSNYLGIDKAVVILENYELDVRYFPLRWKEASIPTTFLGDNTFSNDICRDWKSNSNNEKLPIDYVFLLGQFPEDLGNCDRQMKDLLTEKYKLVHRNKNTALFKRNT